MVTDYVCSVCQTIAPGFEYVRPIAIGLGPEYFQLLKYLKEIRLRALLLRPL